MESSRKGQVTGIIRSIYLDKQVITELYYVLSIFVGTVRNQWENGSLSLYISDWKNKAIKYYSIQGNIYSNAKL